MSIANDTYLTLIGNLTNDPELRFTPSGSAVANFTIASTPRSFDRATNEWKDGDTLFLRCNTWRETAENVAETLTKGMRVIAAGKIKSRSYETKEGEKRTVIEFEVEEIGPSLKFANAKVNRTARQGGQGGGFGGGGSGQSAGQGGQGAQNGSQRSAADYRNAGANGPRQDDPWATPGVSDGGGWGNGPDSEPPF